ncbi:Uma2 family endonuclease [Haliangium sp.]|uniref:Uma2 family endonuclease n=1 Tax=Haliangium sp. TaxID=2663208 RepID=UPI003D0C92B4
MSEPHAEMAAVISESATEAGGEDADVRAAGGEPGVAPAGAERFELVTDDGVPMESLQHRHQMNLFIDVVTEALAARGRRDCYLSGNQFVYYSLEQAEFVATHAPDKYQHLIGPDVFFVDHVSPDPRGAWVVWKEHGRYPDVIVELLSPSTRSNDYGPKKERYERLFRTEEYYLYEPHGEHFDAFHLGSDGRYHAAPRDPRGWVWSPRFELWIGTWHGAHGRFGEATSWLRCYDADGTLIRSPLELAEAERKRAEAERKRAEAERKRADAAERELERLRAELARRG